jgi:uncharacterized membrane protein
LSWWYAAWSGAYEIGGRVDPRGLAAVILAVGISVALVASLVGALISSRVLSQEEVALISGVVGAAVGAVATYLGGGRGPPPGD